jgi:hypothetical protein
METNSSSAQPNRATGMANLRYGVYNQPSNIAGKTVREVRDQFSKIWGIPSDAVAYCGKDKLDENATIQPGQNIEFHRRAGEKG